MPIYKVYGCFIRMYKFAGGSIMDINNSSYASLTSMNIARYTKTRNFTEIRGVTFSSCDRRMLPKNEDFISLEDGKFKKYAELKIIEKGCSGSLMYSSQTYKDSSERTDGILNELNGIGSSETLSCGALCYSYMERTVIIERNIEGAEITTLGTYKEERLYYSELQSGSYSGTDNTLKDGFKYNFDGGFTDSEITEAINDIQSRIDKLVSYKNRMTDDAYAKALDTGYERFGKCAGFLADLFGEDALELIPDKEKYEKLFGEIDADEETFVTKAEEKQKNLSEYLNELTKRRKEWLEKTERKNKDSDIMRKYYDMLSVLDKCSYSDLTAMLFFGKTSMLNTETVL